jgi:two-component system, response regulator / RNA-binding antiterminator
MISACGDLTIEACSGRVWRNNTGPIHALAKMVQRTQDRAMADARMHILILDPNAIRASIIEEGLRAAGTFRITVITEMAGLVRRIAELDPDVIFIDLGNPNRDVLEHMFQVSKLVKRPVAMFVDQSDTTSTAAAIEAGVSAYIVDGLKKERVKAILDMAVSRFNAFDRLRRELEAARTELAERKSIERAKGLLMERKGLSEPEAYAQLRRTAMNRNRRIAEIAESLVMAASLLDDDRSPDHGA